MIQLITRLIILAQDEDLAVLETAFLQVIWNFNLENFR